MSGDQSAVYKIFDQYSSWLHFGGVPQQYVHSQAPQMAGFMGCIHSLIVSVQLAIKLRSNYILRNEIRPQLQI